MGSLVGLDTGLDGLEMLEGTFSDPSRLIFFVVVHGNHLFSKFGVVALGLLPQARA